MALSVSGVVKHVRDTHLGRGGPKTLVLSSRLVRCGQNAPGNRLEQARTRGKERKGEAGRKSDREGEKDRVEGKGRGVRNGSLPVFQCWTAGEFR
eukprot:2114017-Rhodomonas_salina.1